MLVLYSICKCSSTLKVTMTQAFQASLFTQYLGPLKTNQKRTSTNPNNQDRRIHNIAEKLIENYGDLTDEVDRASNHLESLRKAQLAAQYKICPHRKIFKNFLSI